MSRFIIIDNGCLSKLRLLIKNKENSLKKFLCKKISWKKHSSENTFLGKKFLEKNSLETTFLEIDMGLKLKIVPDS
jgi:hypothetical protein